MEKQKEQHRNLLPISRPLLTSRIASKQHGALGRLHTLGSLKLTITPKLPVTFLIHIYQATELQKAEAKVSTHFSHKYLRTY